MINEKVETMDGFDVIKKINLNFLAKRPEKQAEILYAWCSELEERIENLEIRSDKYAD